MERRGVGESLPIVELPGSPREQGRVHGEALRNEIHANVALYTHRLRHDAGLSADDIATRTRMYLEVFARLDSGYRDAMEGVAEASGCRIDEIVMLNARYELLYSAWVAAGTPASRAECTSFGVTRAVTADRHLWLGQNWDWFPGIRGALLDVATMDGLRVLAFTEAGVVGGKIGLNSAGLGLCVNGLGADVDDWAGSGVPFHLRTWRILHSRDLTTAMTHATDGGVACSANFLIGMADDTSDGVVVDVETSPRGSNVLQPYDGLLVHANHFTQPERLGVADVFRVWPPSTYHRADRMRTVFTERRDTASLTPDDFAAAMRDHDGAPQSVCRHPDESQPVHEQTETALSVIIDLDGRELRYTVGPPCLSDYRRVTFP